MYHLVSSQNYPTIRRLICVGSIRADESAEKVFLFMRYKCQHVKWMAMSRWATKSTHCFMQYQRKKNGFGSISWEILHEAI